MTTAIAVSSISGQLKLPRCADSHKETLQDPVAVSVHKELPPAAADNLTAYEEKKKGT